MNIKEIIKEIRDSVHAIDLLESIHVAIRPTPEGRRGIAVRCIDAADNQDGVISNDVLDEIRESLSDAIEDAVQPWVRMYENRIKGAAERISEVSHLECRCGKHI